MTGSEKELTADEAAELWRNKRVTVNRTVYVARKNNHKIIRVASGHPGRVKAVFLTEYNTLVALVKFDNKLEAKINIKCLVLKELASGLSRQTSGIVAE